MPRFRKKPIEVDAVIYDGTISSQEAVRQIAEFMGVLENVDDFVQCDSTEWWPPRWPLRVWIEKSQAWCRVEIGDAVIRESDGVGYYPCAHYRY